MRSAPARRRLEIAMDHALLVSRFERFPDLPRNRQRFFNPERSSRDPLRDRLARGEFHDQKFPVAGFLQSIDCRNIGMIQ